MAQPTLLVFGIKKDFENMFLWNTLVIICEPDLWQHLWPDLNVFVFVFLFDRSCLVIIQNQMFQMSQVSRMALLQRFSIMAVSQCLSESVIQWVTKAPIELTPLLRWTAENNPSFGRVSSTFRPLCIEEGKRYVHKFKTFIGKDKEIQVWEVWNCPFSRSKCSVEWNCWLLWASTSNTSKWLKKEKNYFEWMF